MSYKTLCDQIDALYASGDREQLYDRVRLLALHRLDDEDAAQDVVVEALQSIGDYNGSGAFHAWVNGIISHRWTPLARKREQDAQHDALRCPS